jgi:hypothetical protein
MVVGHVCDLYVQANLPGTSADRAECAAGVAGNQQTGKNGVVEQLAMALTAAREEAVNLRAAQESNRDIGVAIGILMARYLLTREQAFDALRIASQRSNAKLRDLARDVIDTGELAWHPSASSHSSRNGIASKSARV